MDKNLKENDQNSKWNEEAKAAFNEFKKRRLTLPSPPNVSQERFEPKRFKRSKANISNSRFSPNDFCVSDDQNNIQSSTFSDQFMSVDIDNSEFDKTEVVCDEAEKNIAVIREMISNKDDPYAIIEKLTDSFANYYKNSRDLLQKMSNDCAMRVNRLNNQIVSLENDLYNKIDEIQVKSDDKIKAIEVAQKCSKESCVLWLSFVDAKEIEKLRSKNKPELIRESKAVLQRMDIWTNNASRVILDATIQKVTVRFDKEYRNELVLGIKFLSPYIVRDIKRLVTDFVKNQYLNKNFNAVRYTLRDNWSQDIWKILRVCYDLMNFKLIEKVLVMDSGIAVFYTKKDGNIKSNLANKTELNRYLIRNEGDLNALRENISDVACNITTFQFYDSNYFKMNCNERKLHKEKFKADIGANEQMINVAEEPAKSSSNDTSHC